MTDPSTFLGISNIFRNLAERFQDPGGDPITAGAALAGMNALNAPSMLNVCTVFVLWFRAKDRVLSASVRRRIFSRGCTGPAGGEHPDPYVVTAVENGLAPAVSLG